MVKVDYRKKYWWHCFWRVLIAQILFIDSLFFVFSNLNEYQWGIILGINIFWAYMFTPEMYSDEEYEYWEKH